MSAADAIAVDILRLLGQDPTDVLSATLEMHRGAPPVLTIRRFAWRSGPLEELTERYHITATRTDAA